MYKKTFCIFSAQYHPHMGGVENYTDNLSKKLAERGYRVIIVTLNNTNTSFFEKKDKTTIYRLPCMNLLGGRYPVAKKNSQYKRLINKFCNEKVDYIIINTRFYLHSLFASKYAYKRKIPAIVIEHGTSHLSVHNPLLDKVGAVWEHTLTNRVKKYCHKYYGVSLASCEWLEHFGIKGQGALYNAIDIDVVENIKVTFQEHQFRKKQGISNDAVIVAFTGRLLEEKGIKSLIPAMKQICKENKNVHLCIAGEGPLKEYIEQSDEDNIHLLGRLDVKGVLELLVDSDIFCLPSFSEGFSTSILEAAACSCYIITTKRGGSKELVCGAEYGTILDNNSEKLVYEALKWAVENMEECRKIAGNTYARLCETFTWEHTADKVIQIFEEKRK